MRPESEQLEGMLAKAVEQVKKQEPPKDLVADCIKDAVAIHASERSSRVRRRVFHLAAMAAVLLMGIGIGTWLSGQGLAGRSSDYAVDDGHSKVMRGVYKQAMGGLDEGVLAKDPQQDSFQPNQPDAQDFLRTQDGTRKTLEQLSSVIRDHKTMRSATEQRMLQYGTQPGQTPRPGYRVLGDAGNRIDAGRPTAGELRNPKLDPTKEPRDGVDPDRGEVEHTTDQYKHFVSNPFMLVRQDPLSTFSSDVDTASYSMIRKFLKEDNRLPPPDAVRIEELVNYFTYGYAQPKDDHPVSITPEVSACPWNANHRLVRVAVQARSINNDNAPARNLVFLVDVSGSMQPENRLPLVKKSLHLLIDQLRAKDKVSIVVYAGSSGLYMDSTPGDQKDKIRAAVDRLGAGGSTNGAAGITEAYKQAHEYFIQGGTNRVILATDGDFNVGVTSEGDLVRLIEEKRNKGIYLTCLGYGMGNLKDSTIMKLANHGHGHYAYIDTLAEAKKVFVDEGMSLTTLAQDVKLQVEFNPKTVEAYRLIGYEKRIMRHEDFNDDSKHAAVLGCGHRVTVLYEIVPVGKQADVPAADPLKYQVESKLSDAAASGEVLTVKLRYKEPQGQKSKLMEAAVKDTGAAFDKASEDFRWAAAVAAFGRILRDNPKNAGINLAGVRELAESAKGPDLKGYREEFIELVKIAEKLVK